MSSHTGSSFSAARLQPKFQDCALKETDPTTYIFTWIGIIGGIVSNITATGEHGGWELEAFLDVMCKRETASVALRPTFLEDPRLDLGLATREPSLGPEPSFSLNHMDDDADSFGIGSADTASPGAGHRRQHRIWSTSSTL